MQTQTVFPIAKPLAYSGDLPFTRPGSLTGFFGSTSIDLQLSTRLVESTY